MSETIKPESITQSAKTFGVLNRQVLDLQEEIDRLRASEETAWGLISNAGGGDWENESDEWRGAACAWRDIYLAAARLNLNASARDIPGYDKLIEGVASMIEDEEQKDGR